MRRLGYIFLALFLFVWSSVNGQIIKSDVGGVSGLGGIMTPPIAPMGANFEPITVETKPMEQEIKHVAPKPEDCFPISQEGRKEVGEIPADSANYEKSRKFQIDVLSTYDEAARIASQRYYGEINVISATVHENCTRIVLEAKNFANANWFIISKGSIVVDCDTKKVYPIMGVEQSIVLKNSFALNLTRSSYQRICLVFPKLDSWVSMIDIICPAPDELEVAYMNSTGKSGDSDDSDDDTDDQINEN
ncbi:MAG: hypothetical protein R3Y51_04850 [Rikenellaceae bacterium]